MASAQPVYGNFQRYYHIRNPQASSEADDVHPALQLDSRVVSILTFLDSRGGGIQDVLDVGCNSGKLTIQLAQMLQTNVYGVDIDVGLINQAKDAAATARSLTRPISKQRSEQQCRRCLSHESVYFPSVFPTLFGPSPIAVRETSSSAATGTRQTDMRIEFLAAEWTDYGTPVKLSSSPNAVTRDSTDIVRLREIDASRYNVVLALSVTKWVHIHKGDAGLARFFARVKQCLRPNGFLILEPQDWKSYDGPKRMTKELRAKVLALKMRPGADFDWLLESVGLGYVQTIGIGRGTGFTRPIKVYTKSKSTNATCDDAGALARTLLRDTREEVQIPWVTRPGHLI